VNHKQSGTIGSSNRQGGSLRRMGSEKSLRQALSHHPSFERWLLPHQTQRAASSSKKAPQLERHKAGYRDTVEPKRRVLSPPPGAPERSLGLKREKRKTKE